MQSPPRWQRPFWTPGGAEAEVAMVAFSQTPLPAGFTLAGERHGAPSAGVPKTLNLGTLSARDNAEWIQGFFEPELLELARADLGGSPARLGEARHAHTLSGCFPDAPHLDHLQAVWALLRALAEAGCFVFLDLVAARWLSPDEVAALAPDAPFELDREISIILESEVRAEGVQVCHTRGLRKFGRPDLLSFEPPEQDGEATAGLLHALAERLALGEQVGAGDTFRAEDGLERPFLAYDPTAGSPAVHLENAGLVLGSAHPPGPQ